ncbi:MAG: hypothetical protein ACJAYG_002405 [Oceanicoccus sp.]|jgi:hypothetical protein
MDRQQLQQHLDQLSEAVAKMDASSDQKATLEALIVDIERKLLEPSLTEPGSMVEQVDGLVSSFERDHPTVAGILNNIMLTLTSMGV